MKALKALQIILILGLLGSFSCDLFSILICMMANQEVNESLNTLFDKIKKVKNFIIYQKIINSI